MSLIVASFARIAASSCGDISKESPVDNLPNCRNTQKMAICLKKKKQKLSENKMHIKIK